MGWVRIGSDRWIPLLGTASVVVALLWLGARAKYWSAGAAADAATAITLVVGLVMLVSLVRSRQRPAFR